MTVVFELGAVAVALACALHMFWRVRMSRRGAASSGAELVEGQRVLAKRVETFSRNGPTPDRH
jgi:hypothetical protein